MQRNDRKAPRFDDFSPTSPASSKVMRRNRPRDTSAELLLRKALWHRGLRYRLHVRNLPGKPDIVFPRDRIVVFVDADFWHGRDWEKRKAKLERGANRDYWVAKMEYNIERDKRNTLELQNQGWAVIRLWETDIKNDLEGAVKEVYEAVLSRRDS